MWKSKGDEDKRAEKKEKKRARKNSERIIARKNGVQILAYAHAPNQNNIHFCTLSSGKCTFLVKKNRFFSTFSVTVAPNPLISQGLKRFDCRGYIEWGPSNENCSAVVYFFCVCIFPLISCFTSKAASLRQVLTAGHSSMLNVIRHMLQGQVYFTK